MSGETIPALFDSPALDARIVQNLQVVLQDECTWLDLVYPLARIGITKINDEEFKYPQVYVNNGSVNYYDLRPNDNLSSFCFFELNNEPNFEDDNEVTYNLSLIVWYNLKTVDSSKSYDYSRELIQDVLRSFDESDYQENIKNISYDVNPESIFDKYTFSITDTQYLMYPYGAFKITFDYIDNESINCDPFE